MFVAPKLHTQQLDQARGFQVALATTEEEIVACLKLRYQVFAQEMGAELNSPVSGLDVDRFDDHAMHLMVRDERNGRVIATTRLLTNARADQAGGFYSQGEFSLDSVLGLGGDLLEVGRTCIDADYRNGPAIVMLWSGLARLVSDLDIDYLMGCASVPAVGDFAYTHAVTRFLKQKYWAPKKLLVEPALNLPAAPANMSETDAIVPPLLKAYLRIGALVCGEPCWDPDFKVADYFILLEREKISRRYARHFRV